MKALLIGLMILCLVLGAVIVSQAATATWGPNDTVADFAGVNVYRAPGSRANPGAFAKVGMFPKPATSGALTDPAVDGAQCHRATAFDTAGNESVFSNTAEFTYNVVPPKAPATFSVTP